MFRALARDAFSSPVSRILLGSAIGQGTLIAVSPALTRIYSPSDFSAFALVTASSAILGGLVTLSWERAVVVPREETQAADLLLLGIASTLILGASFATAAYIWRHDIGAILNSDVFVNLWWLTPTTALFIGLYGVLSAWIVRQQQYSRLATRNAIQGLVQAISSVALGVLGLVPLGLLTSLAIGRFSGVLAVARGSLRQLKEKAHVTRLIETASHYRRFPLINAWSRLANSLGLQFPLILIVATYGSVETGLYALTIRVLASPIGIVVDATSQYFEGAFARTHRDGAGGRATMIKRFSGRMLLIGTGPALGTLAFAPPLFRAVFGDEWEVAGSFAQLVIFAYLAQFVVSPVSRALVIMGWQFTQLVWDLGRVGATVAAIVSCSIASMRLESCLIALTLIQVISYVTLYALCHLAARRGDAEDAPQSVCSTA